jgi:hypothetical protein
MKKGEVNTGFSINVNGLSSPIIRYRLGEWLKIQDPASWEAEAGGS